MSNKTIITLEIEGLITNTPELDNILEGLLNTLKERNPVLTSVSQESQNTVAYGRFERPVRLLGGRIDKFHIIM